MKGWKLFMKIAGVVTLYNPDDDIIDNINSYLDDIDKLYVIDNSNNSNEKKLPTNKKIEYFPNYENLGVAKALNIGAKYAIKDKCQWLLTMDQDSRFKKGDVGRMISYIKENDCSLVGIVTPWHVINTVIVKPKEEIDHPFEVMTSGNIINLDAYQKVKGFKDWYFIDDIDIEYCMNLNVHGYHIDRLNYIELAHDLGDIKLKHLLGRNFVCSNHNYIRRYYMVRNTFYLNQEYHERFPDYCNFLKRGLRGQLQNIILFEKDKYKKIRNMIRGYRDYKNNVKGVYPYHN